MYITKKGYNGHLNDTFIDTEGRKMENPCVENILTIY